MRNKLKIVDITMLNGEKHLIKVTKEYGDFKYKYNKETYWFNKNDVSIIKKYNDVNSFISNGRDDIIDLFNLQALLTLFRNDKMLHDVGINRHNVTTVVSISCNELNILKIEIDNKSKKILSLVHDMDKEEIKDNYVFDFSNYFNTVMSKCKLIW